MVNSLDTSSHRKYFTYFLHILPQKLQSEDSNQLMILYFTICGLTLLNHEFSEMERKELIDFVYLHLVESNKGFRGALSLKIPTDNTGDDDLYDPPTLPATFAALAILHTLGDDFSRLDRTKVFNYVKACQGKQGSFSTYFGIDDGDLRLCYIACCIRKLLKRDNKLLDDVDFDLDRLVKYIVSRIQYDGGLGSYESHSGLTFCGLAALKLIDSKVLEDKSRWAKTINWLVHRQIDHNEHSKTILEYEFSDEVDIGGFNGRENKFADTCYSFWNIGSLSILNSELLIDVAMAKRYLISVTQNKRGGFAKSDIDDPDPFHTYLGLCSLSLLGNDELRSLDLELVVPMV